MHRQNLDKMLASQEWSLIGAHWNEDERRNLNLVWHRLKGWPDSVEGLRALKKDYIVGTLSNGNMRLLIDMAKYADLPWDVVFSGELFKTYKPWVSRVLLHSENLSHSTVIPETPRPTSASFIT